MSPIDVDLQACPENTETREDSHACGRLLEHAATWSVLFQVVEVAKGTINVENLATTDRCETLVDHSINYSTKVRCEDDMSRTLKHATYAKAFEKANANNSALIDISILHTPLREVIEVNELKPMSF